MVKQKNTPNTKAIITVPINSIYKINAIKLNKHPNHSIPSKLSKLVTVWHPYSNTPHNNSNNTPHQK
jgi:hypothetical protein